MIDRHEEHMCGYADALLRQAALRVAGDRAGALKVSPKVTMADASPILHLEETASWRAAKGMNGDKSPSYIVSVKDVSSDRVLRGAIFEDISLAFGISEGKNGVPSVKTNFEEMATKVEFLCDDLKETLLKQLAQDHLDELNKLYGFIENKDRK